MQRWIVGGPDGKVWLFDGATLRRVYGTAYYDILVFHGASVPAGGGWFPWTQAQVDAVPKVIA